MIITNPPIIGNFSILLLQALTIPIIININDITPKTPDIIAPTKGTKNITNENAEQIALKINNTKNK